MSPHPFSLLRVAIAAALGLATIPGADHAWAADVTDQSGPVLIARYRHERVDDSAFSTNAEADTLRLRLGYRWVSESGWLAYVESEHVRGLLDQQYNSTANGKTQYPVVADPNADEVNQAWVGYKKDNWQAALGRQEVNLDNQRFFGTVGWRQNEQTFDALSANYQFGQDGPKLRYLHLDRVLRINGHDNPNPLLREWSLNGNLLNLSQSLPLGVVTAYAYLVENKDIATLSTRTFGARWNADITRERLSYGLTAEWATQSDYANNPLSEHASYRLVEPRIAVNGITIKAGWEVLGGNGRYGFSTPYATLHAFNGWADKFLGTPVNGLDDRYLGVSGALGKSKWSAAWHDFHADRGNAHYGSEWDASIAYPLRKNLTGLLKLADYRGDEFGSDTRKLWLSLDYHY
jgi:hypothetical protein